MAEKFNRPTVFFNATVYLPEESETLVVPVSRWLTVTLAIGGPISLVVLADILLAIVYRLESSNKIIIGYLMIVILGGKSRPLRLSQNNGNVTKILIPD